LEFKEFGNKLQIFPRYFPDISQIFFLIKGEGLQWSCLRASSASEPLLDGGAISVNHELRMFEALKQDHCKPITFIGMKDKSPEVRSHPGLG